jgi:hypothetical protein
MAFALSIVKLEEAMKKPGCMICRTEQETAIHTLKSMLWESTTDFQHRELIKDAYGFCPEHTRMLVALELSNSGPVLGVNLIYESVVKKTLRNLQGIQPGRKFRGGLYERLIKIGLPLPKRVKPEVLPAKMLCPACTQSTQSGLNALSTLFEQIEARDENFVAHYQQSDGLCFTHLRLGLTQLMEDQAQAAAFLIEDTKQRLGAQQKGMLEYIRKHNWAYRNEQMSEDEKLAWIKTLTFYTGHPESRFSHKLDEF